MSDDLVKRARDAHENSPQRIAGSNIFAELVDRIEALERERDAAYTIGYGDCENETSFTEIGRTNEFLHGQIAKYRDALAAVTAERDEWQASWQEVLTAGYAMKDRAEAAEAALAAMTQERERLGREVNMARYGQPDFAWSTHKEAMADLEARLAKAVEALRVVDDEYTDHHWGPELSSMTQVRATLAEMGGMTDE